jgi:glutathione synthase/RimK-type ligase-like ATP-grasp enzyme
MNYKKILIGTGAFFNSWIPYIEKLNDKQNIIARRLDTVDIDELVKQVDYVIPMSLREYNIVRKFDKKVLFPNLETFELFNNKVMFTKFMLDNFPNNIPETYVLDKKEILQPQDKTKIFVTKSDKSVSGSGVFLSHGYDSAITKKHVVQEYIDSEYEYSAYLLVIDGKIINYKVLRQKYKGPVIKRKNFGEECEIVESFDLELFNKILSKVNYVGPVNFDFKIKDNVIKIFEANPRFGGSVVVKDFVYDLICFRD